MSVLTELIQEAVNEAEQNSYYHSDTQESKYRLQFHLMPPVGWLNDPNGLCQFQGIYHVFFQYTPFDVNGGLKVWGHYTSRDLIHWRYEGTPILPDEAWDCHGVYSGSALVEDGQISIFYTGNVKLPGKYDYIHAGREANTILISSADGRTWTPKTCVLDKRDYPDTYTCHIRDPKVWKEDDTFYMVLGGRKLGDKGAVLLYESKDLKKWTLQNELTTTEPFGYMWECPDLILQEGKWFLGVSPQGLEREEFRYQNIYQSGYFVGKGDYKGEYQLEEFREWDLGFDFYAPQTFVDEQGRRILIGWVGLPDVEGEYQNLSIKEGWQHALTVPREITIRGNQLYQYPVQEISELRVSEEKIESNSIISVENGIFDLEIEQIFCKKLDITIEKCAKLIYHEGIFQVKLQEEAGVGRHIRQARIKEIHSIRVLCDVSLLEVFINEGEYVFTTRFYKEQRPIAVTVDCKSGEKRLYHMKGMEVVVGNE